MSYELLYSDRSIAHLGRVPSELRDEVEDRLLRLADSPSRLSIRIASPPFPPRGQLYHFTTTDDAGSKWFFTVIFRYSQDETALHVLSITWREIEDEPGS